MLMSNNTLNYYDISTPSITQKAICEVYSYSLYVSSPKNVKGFTEL